MVVVVAEAIRTPELTGKCGFCVGSSKVEGRLGDIPALVFILLGFTSASCEDLIPPTASDIKPSPPQQQGLRYEARQEREQLGTCGVSWVGGFGFFTRAGNGERSRRQRNTSK